MKKHLTFYAKTGLFFAVLVFSLLWHCKQAALVKASPRAIVKYQEADNSYYLHKPDGQRVSREGLYSIPGKKVHHKTFDGIYYVTASGKIRTTQGVCHVPAKTIGGTTYTQGYYYLTPAGSLARSKGVAYLKNVKINQRSYHGYYYYDAHSKISDKSYGLVYLNCKANNKQSFSGYYYRDAFSRLAPCGSIRKITLKNGANRLFSGYHYFGKAGIMVTKPVSRYLDTTYQGIKYKGFYCFAGPDGEMVRKKGLVTLGDTYYYVTNNTGLCLTDTSRKIDGFSYKFKDNGLGIRTSTKLSGLRAKLINQLRSYSGTWSVYIRRLDNNDSITINDVPMYAASVIKPYAMASIYDQIAKGNIRETDTITSLTRSMITVSSNDAFNELVKRQTNSYSFSAGRSIINTYLKTHGYRNTEVHHTLHPASGGLITDGGSNCTSVKDCGRLLEEIYRGTCVNRESSKKMLNFLLAQQRRWKIPAGLPRGTKVANKTGETSTSDHDMAIVYGPKCTYVLCVMTRNASSSSGKIASISRVVYDYLN